MAVISVILVIRIVFGTAVWKKPLISQAGEKGSLNYSVDRLDSGRTKFVETGKKLNIKTAKNIETSKGYSVKELLTEKE